VGPHLPTSFAFGINLTLAQPFLSRAVMCAYIAYLRITESLQMMRQAGPDSLLSLL
jgi:hypothetical protein